MVNSMRRLSDRRLVRVQASTISLPNMSPERISSERSANMIEITGKVFERENHAFFQRDERRRWFSRETLGEGEGFDRQVVGRCGPVHQPEFISLSGRQRRFFEKDVSRFGVAHESCQEPGHNARKDGSVQETVDEHHIVTGDAVQ